MELARYTFFNGDEIVSRDTGEVLVVSDCLLGLPVLPGPDHE